MRQEPIRVGYASATIEIHYPRADQRTIRHELLGPLSERINALEFARVARSGTDRSNHGELGVEFSETVPADSQEQLAQILDSFSMPEGVTYEVTSSHPVLDKFWWKRAQATESEEADQ